MGKRFNKVRKQEIQFKKSLFRFCVIFFFILITGIISNSVLSNLPLQKRLIENIDFPENLNIEIQKPEVRFRQGLMPVLGLAFQRIQLEDQQCSSRRLLAHNVLFVLNPWRLIFGEIKFGWTKIGFLEIDVPENCLQPPQQTEVLEADDGKQSVYVQDSANVKKVRPTFFKNETLKELFLVAEKMKSWRKISYLIVDAFEFRFLKSGQPPTTLKGSMSAKNKARTVVELNLSEIEIGKSKMPFNSSRLEALLGIDSFQLKYRGALREGKGHLNFTIENKKTYPSQLVVDLEKLPVSSLASFFLKGSQISYLWVSCKAQLKTSWQNLLSHPLNLTECGVDGPYGNLVISEIEASLMGVTRINAELNKLDLDKVLKTKRDLIFSGIFSNYGVLSTQVNYKNKVFSVDGILENSEFIFSNNKLRDIQRVKKIPFSIQGKASNWQAFFSKVELDEGLFEGDVQVVMEQSGQARGKISIHKLRFHPKIYQLMFKAKPAVVKVYGKFLVIKNKIKNWSAFLVTPLLESDFYQFKNLKIRGQNLDKKTSEIRVTAASGQVSSEAEVVSWLQPTRLEPVLQKSLLFKELSIKLLLDKSQSIAWKRGYVRLKNGWQLSTEGTGFGEGLESWLQWDKPGGRYLKWGHRGSLLSGRFKPRTQWVQKWLEAHPEFLKKNPSIDFEVSKNESLGAKINQAGKTAIDKVKSVLGNKKEKEEEKQ